MTYVHRCPCGEPQVACCCHLRAPVRLVDDPSVAADDRAREAAELLRYPSDLDVEASFARVRDRLRRLVLDTPAVPQADEWVVAGMVACDDASERARHRREVVARPLRRDGAS